MTLDAWGWCTGTTQRDGMGREVGGGFRMGNTCIPVADSFLYMAKPIQYCKVKKNKQIKFKRKLKNKKYFTLVASIVSDVKLSIILNDVSQNTIWKVSMDIGKIVST